MINGISGYNPYSTYSLYGSSYANRAQTQGAERAQAAQRSGVVLTARKAAQPDTPVQPVSPARPVSAQEDPAQEGLLRFGSDPAEMAVRMRIQYPGGNGQQAGGAQAADAQQAAAGLPDAKGSVQQAQNPVQDGGRAADGQEAQNPLGEAKSAQEVMEEAECQTCAERKYQDGSDDPGVSFKTPTNISPDQAAAAVRGHENEHVVREQAQAKQEGRKVVSQSVTMHTDICPECGKVYVSGGTTRTVTKADDGQQAGLQQQNEQQDEKDAKAPFSVVA